MEASTQVPNPVGMGWCMDHDELTGEKGCRLLWQSWNFCLVTAKRNVYRTVVLAYRTVYSAQILQAELCANQAPEDEDDAEDFYNDDSDEDESDSETDESF